MTAAKLILLLAWLFPGFALMVPPVWHGAARAVAQVQSAQKWMQWKKAETHPRVRASDPSAWLSIPDCDLSLLVLREATEENLHTAPGFANWAGPRVILGHRDTHLRPLERIREGHAVSLEWETGAISRYRVIHTEVTAPAEIPSRISSLAEPEDLFLVTCFPFRYIGPAPRRFLVQARPL